MMGLSRKLLLCVVAAAALSAASAADAKTTIYNINPSGASNSVFAFDSDASPAISVSGEVDLTHLTGINLLNWSKVTIEFTSLATHNASSVYDPDTDTTTLSESLASGTVSIFSSTHTLLLQGSATGGKVSVVTDADSAFGQSANLSVNFVGNSGLIWSDMNSHGYGGSGAFSFTWSALLTGDPVSLINSNKDISDFSAQTNGSISASITGTTVPLPASFASGLGCLGLLVVLASKIRRRVIC
jgi:hypothetical protein